MTKIIKENGKFYYEGKYGINYKKQVKEIKVCGCDDEYQVPLIWTFAFISAEYWCPYCGNITGMMGAGEDIAITKELINRKNKYEEISEDFLHAKSTGVCVSLVHNGKRINPEDLPDKEKQKHIKAIEDWKYNVQVESLKLGYI